MCASSFVIFLIYCIQYDGVFDVSFLTDYRFYLSQALLIGLIMVQIEGRKQCEDNIPLFNFSSFLVISAAPIVSLFISSVMPFKNTVEANYESNLSLVGMCGITFLLTAVYYRLKFKSGAINKMHWLIMNILVGTFSIVLYTKIIQEYNPYAFLVATNGINICIFLVMAILNRELSQKALMSDEKAKLLSVAVFYCLSQYLNTHVVTKVPVEQYVTVRSAGIVLMGYAYYYLLDRKILFNRKDILILTLMIATQIYFTM